LSFEFKSNSRFVRLSCLPALINLLRGDLSLIGPRADSPNSIGPSERLAWRRYNVRPGFLCLWWIRQRTNIAYGSEAEIDSEYIDQRALLSDVGIALRAVPAALYGRSTPVAWSDRISLVGIPVDNLTMDEAIQHMVQPASGEGTRQVCFVNADCVNIAFRNSEYRGLLSLASLVLGDGIGVKLAGRILNQPIRQNVNGTDLFPRLCAELERCRLGIYLLGGKPGVAPDVARWIEQHHPALPVRGCRHGYFSDEEEAAVITDIANSGAQVLLVAFGAPKQDQWIERNLDRLGVPVASGVGGLFDFYSGRIPRAPVWLREIGLEWIYRFLQEPRRMWRRYFVGNAVFLFRVLKERTPRDTNKHQF
jgi:N-acetylglucosaminyldiphosphoundecaprenol N-acetyl-beta-D-mannosaminyltransferase